MNRKGEIFLSTMLTASFFVFFLHPVFAKEDNTIPEGGATGFGAATLIFMRMAGFNTNVSAQGAIFSPISKIILSFFTFLGVIFLALMVYAGFRWMTAGGSEDIVEKSRKIIRDSMIGLFVVLASFFVVYFIMAVAANFSAISN